MRWMAVVGAGVSLFALQGAEAMAKDAPTQGSVVQPGNAQGDLSLTIYNNDLALIQDVRSLNLPHGHVALDLPDVSARIRPETVTIAAANTSVIEQNFDYDLLSPQRLLDKSVGQDVSLVRTNPATGVETTEQAKVLANNGGTLVQIGNRIEVLGQTGGRLVFPGLPEGLKAHPTLSVTLDSGASGTRPVTLSYLSQGFGWKADYVALFDEASGKLDVQGWVTLNNSTGTAFPHARVLLVAGRVGGGDEPSPPRIFRARTGGLVKAGTQSSEREQLGDYYVYPIDGRTSVAGIQQKQIGFLDVKGAQAERAYVFTNGWQGSQDEAQSATTQLRFTSSREGGLGDALPAGTVRVYMRDARGQPQFIGEDNIGHTPMGSSVALGLGSAFDVKVQPVVEGRDHITGAEWDRVASYRITEGGAPRVVTVDRTATYWRTRMSYRLTNAKSVPVTVELAQDGLDNGWHDTRVSAESVKGEQVNADRRLWRVTVPAHGEVKLTAQFDTRY
ncbi:DUF4139 domain-containing protein [Novosphingobium rosa]|uniref:DUF4139 domain-containing protein n=1 Tax=Novosphingobium rosa TaxID=76978 RepID=UPI0009FBDD54|nr:DUF4139 domain-containing protein [Novosphingobium rosa]